MDSIQFWIWLIVIVVSLIARANKKKPQQYNPEGDDSQQAPSETNKPISFEDLLREIQASKSPEQAKPIATTTYKPIQQATKEVDYDDDLEEEIKPLEKPDYTYNDDQIYETYESAKKAAFSRASLEETMHVEDTKVTYQQFQPYDKVEHKSPAAKYAKELRSPQSVKRALVLSEILNRKF